MKVRLSLILGYLAIVVLGAGALFASSVYFSPHLVFDYIVVLFSVDARISFFIAFVMLGVVGGLIVGVSFGIPLGFATMSCANTKAVCVGVGTVAFSLLLRIPLLWVAEVKIAAPLWSLFIESLSFLVTLYLVVVAIDRLARGLKFKTRIIFSGSSLLIVLFLYHKALLTFLPSVFS